MTASPAAPARASIPAPGASLTRHGDTVLIDICDPATLNGIHDGNLERLPELIREAGAEVQTKYIVVTGGPYRFCTGGGTEFLARLGTLPLPERLAVLERGQAWVNSLLESPCLTIAAVDGLVAGAGVDFMLAFDSVLLRPSAKISFFYNRLGAIPDLGGLQLLAERVGPSRALAFYAGSTAWDRSAACLHGLGEPFDAAFPDDPEAWSRLLARRCPIDRHAFSAAKRALNTARRRRLRAHQRDVARTQAAIFGSEGFKERLQRVATMQRLVAG